MSISVSTDFSDFCSRLKMPDADVSYSFYVGSYGRGTEIYTSDIDIVVVLPYEVYVQYNNYAYNGQSQLLQTVKNSLKKTYSSSTLNGNGQVVDINFSDSKYKNKLTLEWKRKYKLLAENGINKIK